MSELIASLGSVTGLVLGLCAGVVWLFAAPASRGPRRFLAVLLIVYAAASVHAVSRGSSWPLRRGFQSFEPADAPPRPYAIVLLGAGARTVHGRADRLGVLTLGGASRVLEAVRVFRALHGPLLVSSGGPPPGRDMIPESETMKAALVELGVPADRIALESASRVTHDEAVLTSQLLRARGIRACVVVTSDLHMRRALAAFRREGLDARPAIARDPLDAQRPVLQWLPTPQGMDYSREVVHEYVGLAWYWWRGWV
jgi:uncharacterized SAM-binding protein YcdF (DUF218 family)